MQLAFLCTEYHTPAYLLLDNCGYSTPIIINSFTGTPPSYSWFTLPSECVMAKSKQGKKVTANLFQKPGYFQNEVFLRTTRRL